MIETFNQLLYEVRKLVDWDSIDTHLYFDKYVKSHIKIFNTHNRIIDEKGFKVKFEEKTHEFIIYYGRKIDEDGFAIYKNIKTTQSIQQIYNIIKAIKEAGEDNGQ